MSDTVEINITENSDVVQISVTENSDTVEVTVSDQFDGDYNHLANKPTLFSGSYNDLSDKPTIPDAITELNDIPDVDISSPSDGDMLRYNGTTGKYEAVNDVFVDKTTNQTIKGDKKFEHDTLSIYAYFKGYGTDVRYPRATFFVGSSSGNSIYNSGLWVIPDVSTGQKNNFIEILTSNDTGTTSTKRLWIFQGTTEAQIRTSSSNGNTAGTPLVIFTHGNTNQLYINTDGNVGIGKAPTVKLDVNGKIKATSINFSGLPTSASGLSSGDVWNDGGTLKIV